MTKMPLLAVQVVGSLIGNDFTKGMAGVGVAAALLAAYGIFLPLMHCAPSPPLQCTSG